MTQEEKISQKLMISQERRVAKYSQKASPVCVLLSNNQLAIRSSQDLISSFKAILNGARRLIHSKYCYFFLRKENGKFILLSNNRRRDLGLSPEVQKILRYSLLTSSVLEYKKGEKLFDANKVVIGKVPENIICASIGAGGKKFGSLIFIDSDPKDSFDAEDENMLISFCSTLSSLFEQTYVFQDHGIIFSDFLNTIAFLLEKSYLYQKYKHSNSTLEEVINVSKMINSSTDIKSLLESILSSAKKVLKAESSSLLLIDEKTNELYFNIVAGEKEKELKEIRVPVGKGIAGIVAQNGESLIINDALNDDRVFKNVDEQTNFITRNLICAPLRVRKKIIGVIEVINSVGRSQFSHSDLHLFTSFSDHAALAINNRDLIDNLKKTNTNLKRKVNELSTLFQVSSLINEAITEQEIFDKTVDIVRNKLGIQRCAILLVDDTSAFSVASEYGLPMEFKERLFDKNKDWSDSIYGQGLLSKLPVVAHRSQITDAEDWQRLVGYQTDSIMIVPMIVNRQAMGIMIFSDKEDGTDFNQDDDDIVSSVVNQVLKGYESILLHQEIIKNETLKKEIETSQRIQESILPHHLPRLEGLDLAAMSRPAKQVGGDFYDFTPFDNQKLGISVADVSGKSLPAALFMAATSSIIRTLARAINAPNTLLYHANDLVYQNSHSGMFVTLFYIIVDLSNQKAIFSSAGHNTQILIKKNLEIQHLQASGPPLGILAKDMHKEFGLGEVAVESGDILVLYTDGVVEAINPNKEEYEMDRFIQVLLENRHLEAAQMIEKVFAAVNEFAATEPQFDDFTLVIAKIH